MVQGLPLKADSQLAKKFPFTEHEGSTRRTQNPVLDSNTIQLLQARI
jgi:hypothetical protein